MLTRQDVERREKAARTRPPWRQRPRRPVAATVLSLSNVGGLALGLLAITPVLLLSIGFGYVTTDPRLSHRVMGGVLIAAAPITLWIEASILRAYLRRPVHRRDLSGRQSRD